MALGTKIPHFTLVRELGSAGPTRLYLAKQTGLDRQAVVRVLRRDQPGTSEAQLRQFENEGRLLARIQHQGVVRIYQIGSTDAVLFRAMEYLGGGSLQQRIDAGTMTSRGGLACCKQLAEALQALHQLNVFQYGLCPGRILFRENGAPVFTDLGVAGGISTHGSDVTVSNSELVPDHVSPEVLQGCMPDVRSDAFALGMLLRAMLLANGPFGDRNERVSAWSQTNNELGWLPPDLANLRPILSRLLAEDPNQRYQNMAELLDDPGLQLLNDHGVATKRELAAKKTHLFRGKLRNVSLGSALVLAAALFAAWQLLPPRLSEADQQLITQELQAFEGQMARMEIYGPAGGNATETVNRLISIARGKPYPEVQRAAERLADVYLRDAYNSYLRKNFEDALVLVEKGAELSPQHPSLAELGLAIGEALTAHQVADLLDAADAALSRRIFVPPMEGNAYSVFRQIQSLDPGNREAETGMREIQLHIAEQARGAWGTEGLEEARMLALRGLELFPDSVLLNDLLADMNRAEQSD